MGIKQNSKTHGWKILKSQFDFFEDKNTKESFVEPGIDILGFLKIMIVSHFNLLLLLWENKSFYYS